MSTIKVNSIQPNSGTHVSGAFTGTFSGSIENGRLDRLESFSSSLDAAFATDAQLTSLSSSAATTGSNRFIGNQTITGSLTVSSSTNQLWATPEFQLYNGLGTVNFALTPNVGNQFTIQAYGTKSEILQANEPLRLLSPTLQFVKYDNTPTKVEITGSLNVSGSIIPAIGSSATSSFSLGSATNAWKDIWVSQGTIRFLNGAGVQQGALSTTADGIETSGDIFVNSTVRVGKGPGNNGLNTAVGSGALQSNTSGSNNTAFGGSALSSNTTGELNTAIGLSSMAFNSTGYYNTAVGQGSFYSNNGIANTAVGVRAGNGSTDANNSTLMGYEALRNVTTGDGNTAIGYQAGFYASGSSSNNLYLGYNAGPTASITENSKLYIDFQQNNKPLIGGDFVQREVTVNGMLNVTTFLTLPPQHPLSVNPSPTLGSMAVSGSLLYFYNGSAWKEVSLVP
jgi:hypothetical protein